MHTNELLFVPFLTAHRVASGNVALPEKFIVGLLAYAERWQGKVTAIVRISKQADSCLDHLEIHPGEYPFNIEEIAPSDAVSKERLRQASLAIGDIMGTGGIRALSVKEYSFLTEMRIITSDTRNIIKKLNRALFVLVKYLIILPIEASKLAGIQCNGIPAFNQYKHWNKNTLLFFDSRILSTDLSGPEEQEGRAERLLSGNPLHLVFTGRLVKIKGVDHLPLIAEELLRLGVRFEMSICGGGDYEALLAQSIKRRGLESRVRLRGVLRFREELLPFIREFADIFVCTHIQGDPSCTYLETLACGVPIVGYANEAWVGMAPLCRAGWVTPLKKPKLLAAKIAQLDKDRPALVAASSCALEFAERHHFERTMDKRVAHLHSCLKAGE